MLRAFTPAFRTWSAMFRAFLPELRALTSEYRAQSAAGRAFWAVYGGLAPVDRALTPVHRTFCAMDGGCRAKRLRCRRGRCARAAGETAFDGIDVSVIRAVAIGRFGVGVNIKRDDGLKAMIRRRCHA